MTSYRTKLTVTCDGDEHAVGITPDGEAIMLDHDVATLEAFTAFGAKVPPCLALARAFNAAMEAYRAGRGQWTGAYPERRIEFGDPMAPELAGPRKMLLLQAPVTSAKLSKIYSRVGKRYDKARRDYDHLFAKLITGPEGPPPSLELIKTERDQLLTLLNELANILRHLEAAEAAAKQAENAAADAYEALLFGDIDLAAQSVDFVHFLEQKHRPPAGQPPIWRPFMLAVKKLRSLCTEHGCA
jgi:hypothetical protein